MVGSGMRLTLSRIFNARVQVCVCNAIGLAANAAAAYYFSQGADVRPHLHIHNRTNARVFDPPPQLEAAAADEYGRGIFGANETVARASR